MPYLFPPTRYLQALTESEKRFRLIKIGTMALSPSSRLLSPRLPLLERAVEERGGGLPRDGGCVGSGARPVLSSSRESQASFLRDSCDGTVSTSNPVAIRAFEGTPPQIMISQGDRVVPGGGSGVKEGFEE